MPKKRFATKNVANVAKVEKAEVKEVKKETLNDFLNKIKECKFYANVQTKTTAQGSLVIEAELNVEKLKEKFNLE